MPDFKYLIVGGGLAADAAVKGIREVDPSGTIGLIGEEPDPPYSRPPLSKALWKGKPLDRIWRYTEKHGVNLLLGRRATRLDPAHQTVIDDRGDEYGYSSPPGADHATCPLGATRSFTIAPWQTSGACTL